MRILTTCLFILFFLNGIAQKKVETSISEKQIIDQLSLYSQRNDLKSLNQLFPKYIEQLEALYDNGDYEGVKSSYLSIVEKPFYVSVSDSLKANTLMAYGLALSANQQYQESLDIYEVITQKYQSVLNRNIPLQVRLYIEFSFNYSNMGNQKRYNKC